jgi:hypothetical protein
MEFMEDTRPASAAFTSPASVRIVAEDGTMCANFEAGETRTIPKALFNEALKYGMMPVDTLDAAPPPEPVKPPQEEIVADGLIEACKKLITRGNPADFTVVGQPRAASVKKLVDFNFTTKDVERAFGEAMHEVEQDGDESTEHSEPSSSAAE